MPAPRTAYYRVEHRAYRRKFLRPLATARGEWSVREGLVVRLTDPDGRIGYGEAAPAPGFGVETTARDRMWLQRAPNQLTAAELRRVPKRLGSLRWAFFCAKGMVEGRRQFSTKVRKLPVCALLPAGAPAVAALDWRAGEGYRVFKWKVGMAAPPEEFSLLEKLLAALPAGARLRLDANGGLSRREWAAWCDGLNALGPAAQAIEFFEQPLPPATGAACWREQKRLAAIAPVPVALDESVAGWPARANAQLVGWPGPLVIKPSLMGEGEAFQLWRSKADADLVYSSVFETSIGLQAALELAAGDARAGRRALGFGTLAAFADDGLQLPVHAPGPTLALRALGPADFLDVWNRLAR